jgi:hypothetical protein
MYTRKDKILLDSEFYDSETWAALNKCWKGYKIAKHGSDTNKMFYYAKGIRKFGRQLGIEVMDFPQFGLIGRFVEQEREPVNYWKSGSYRQTDEEIQEYEQRDQTEDPYRMEQEPDPWKEQEEYMQRRGRECI